MSQRIFRGTLLLALFAAGCASQPSPPSAAPAPPTHTTAEAKASSPLPGWIDRYVTAIGGGDETQSFHGDVLLARGDEVVVHRAYHGEPDRRYRIGSVTKPFTAVAILQLAAKGTLSIDDSIRKHVPELPETYQQVTLAHLLSHRGGVANYTQDAELMAKRGEPHTQAQMLELIAKAPLKTEPGTNWSYSNSGYYLLGLVVERASGKPWASYLAEHVFAPAGMTDTDATLDDLAPGLTVKSGAIAPAHPADPSIPYAAGAISSTARDLLRFALALQDDTLLPEPWRERMWKDRGGPTSELGWSYGWMLRDRDGVATVGHNGGIDGFNSVFELTRDGAWTMVALSNLETVDAGNAGTAALKMALTGTPIEPPKPAAYLTFDPQLGAALIGLYALPAAVEAKLREQLGDDIADAVKTATFTADGTYIFQPVGQGPVELRLRDDGRLVDPATRIELTAAEKESDTEPQRLILKQGGLTLIYERVSKAL